jgi:hypothetical protein
VCLKEGKCRNRLGVEEGKCGSNLVDSKAVAQVGEHEREFQVRQGSLSKRENAEKTLWTSNLSLEWEHERTRVPEGGVVVVQLDLVWLVCGSVGVCLSYEREDRVRSSTCGWWATDEG